MNIITTELGFRKALKCNVSSRNKKSEIEWNPFFILLENIQAVVCSGVTDAPENYNNFAVIFDHSRNSFITDIPFDEFIDVLVNNQ